MSLEGKIWDKLRIRDIGGERITNILSKAKFFFQNEKGLWPLGDSQYYLGHVPKLEPLLPPTEEETRLEREQVIHGIFCEWHNTSVRLAHQQNVQFFSRFPLVFTGFPVSGNLEPGNLETYILSI
jgi:hypothetical protein